MDRTTAITRSIEVLVRTLAAPDNAPPADREIRGESAAIAAELHRFAELGIDHLKVQLRPNSIEGVEAFVPVIAAVRV